MLLSHVAQDLKLDRLLERVFGESLAQRILSLAYYCAFDGLQPLSRMNVWFEDQLLPWEHSFSLGMIEKTLVEMAASDILTFLQAWMKQFPREDRLSLDITSVSSYSQNSIPDVSRGYNRDRENLPQINLLMLVSQRSRLPLWFEQLPGAIADITTIKDTIRLLKELDDTPRSIVFDRGFADQGNIACLMGNPSNSPWASRYGVFKTSKTKSFKPVKKSSSMPPLQPCHYLNRIQSIRHRASPS